MKKSSKFSFLSSSSSSLLRVARSRCGIIGRPARRPGADHLGGRKAREGRNGKATLARMHHGNRAGAMVAYMYIIVSACIPSMCMLLWAAAAMAPPWNMVCFGEGTTGRALLSCATAARAVPRRRSRCVRTLWGCTEDFAKICREQRAGRRVTRAAAEEGAASVSLFGVCVSSPSPWHSTRRERGWVCRG